MNLWYFQRLGRCETVRSVIPSSATVEGRGQLEHGGGGPSEEEERRTGRALVEQLLDLERDGARALVEDGVLGEREKRASGSAGRARAGDEEEERDVPWARGRRGEPWRVAACRLH